MGIEEKELITLKLIEGVLKSFDKVLVAFSGGKDSTLMLYYVVKAVEESKLKYPYILVSDPFPIPKSLEHCMNVLRDLHYPKDKLILMKDLVDQAGYSVFNKQPRDVKACCLHNKINTVNRLISDKGFQVMMVAVRWDEHEARSKDPYIRKIDSPPHLRVEPVLHWSWKDVLTWYRRHPQLLNPLYLEGYTSLGCSPCTRPSLNAKFNSVDEYIDYVLSGAVKEREGRIIDKEKVMERLRELGYF